MRKIILLVIIALVVISVLILAQPSFQCATMNKLYCNTNDDCICDCYLMNKQYYDSCYEHEEQCINGCSWDLMAGRILECVNHKCTVVSPGE